MKHTTFTTVRELLADKSRWTQKAFSRDALGINTAQSGAKPICWCVEGAILEVYGPYVDNTHRLYLFNTFLQKQGYSGAIDVNDILGYEVIYPLVVEAGI